MVYTADLQHEPDPGGTTTMTDAKFWDRAAEKYARAPIRDLAAYEATLDRVRSYLRPDDEVLELGCGTGSTALRLAPFVRRILASDLSAEMIGIGRDKAAAEGIGNVGFALAAADAPPEGQFDVVMAFNLLHLLRDLDGALARIATRVRPGGLFISKTVCLSGSGAPLALRLLLGTLPLMQLVGRAPFVHRFDTATLEAAIISAGFEIIETGDYPARPARRFVVARKPG